MLRILPVSVWHISHISTFSHNRTFYLSGERVGHYVVFFLKQKKIRRLKTLLHRYFKPFRCGQLWPNLMILYPSNVKNITFYRVFYHHKDQFSSKLTLYLLILSIFFILFFGSAGQEKEAKRKPFVWVRFARNFLQSYLRIIRF